MRNAPLTADDLDALPALLPYQQRWFSDESKVKVHEKSRRIGISWTSACKHAFVAGEGLMDGWYIGYSEDQGEEFIRDVASWAKVLHDVAIEHECMMLEDVDPESGETSAIKAFRVDFASGCKVTALSSRPRNLRGKQGIVTIDEAAYHDALRALIKSAVALLMWGGQIEIISTHDGVDNEFNKLIEEIRAGKFPYSLHRVTLDDALDDGLYERICLVNGKRWSEEAESAWRAELVEFYGDGAEEELFCVPSRGGATYFLRDVVESRMVSGRQVARLDLDHAFVSRPETERVRYVQEWLDFIVAPLLQSLPAGRPHYVGQDFGRVSDLTCFAPGTLLEDLTRDVPFMVELSNVPFEQQKQVAFFILDRLPRFERGHFDATGNGAYLAEVCAQKYGHHRIEQVKIGEKWHIETWPPVKAFLEEGKLLLPSDEAIRSDFTAVKRVNGIPKLPAPNVVKVSDDKTRKQRRHGDGAIAVAMMVAASRERTIAPPRAVHIRGL